MRTCLKPVEKKDVRQVKESTSVIYSMAWYFVFYTLIFIYGKWQTGEVLPTRLNVKTHLATEETSNLRLSHSEKANEIKRELRNFIRIQTKRPFIYRPCEHPTKGCKTASAQEHIPCRSVLKHGSIEVMGCRFDYSNTSVTHNMMYRSEG